MNTRRWMNVVNLLAVVTVLALSACGTDNKKSATASSSAETTTTSAPSCHDVTGTLNNHGVSPTEMQGTLTGDSWLFGATHVTDIKAEPATNSLTDYATVTNQFGVLAGPDIGSVQADGVFQDVWTPDPTASTGRYAGANGSVTFRANVASGRVCVPHD